MLQISWIVSSYLIMRHCCSGERCGPLASCWYFISENTPKILKRRFIYIRSVTLIVKQRLRRLHSAGRVFEWLVTLPELGVGTMTTLESGLSFQGSGAYLGHCSIAEGRFQLMKARSVSWGYYSCNTLGQSGLLPTPARSGAVLDVNLL